MRDADATGPVVSWLVAVLLVLSTALMWDWSDPQPVELRLDVAGVLDTEDELIAPTAPHQTVAPRIATGFDGPGKRATLADQGVPAALAPATMALTVQERADRIPRLAQDRPRAVTERTSAPRGPPTA